MTPTPLPTAITEALDAFSEDIFDCFFSHASLVSRPKLEGLIAEVIESKRQAELARDYADAHSGKYPEYETLEAERDRLRAKLAAAQRLLSEGDAER